MTAPWAAPTTVEQFVEAALWLLARIPLAKVAWNRLDVWAQRRAMTVAGVASADLIRDVLLALDRSVANGTTLDDFKKDVGRKLEDAWAGSVSNPAWRLETIYRTNCQQAYNAGRHRQMSDPQLVRVRPYWMFDAILDNRTTFGCERADGTVLPVEHPWWKANYPPRHFNCRSVVRSLRKRQAKRRGITAKPSTEPAQKGFGLPPDEGEWEPDTSKYPPEIRDELEARLGRIKNSDIEPGDMPRTQ